MQVPEGRGPPLRDLHLVSQRLELADHVRGKPVLDPQALQATRANGLHNDVADRLIISSPEKLATQPADLVIANILANPLVELAGRLGDLVSLHGRIVLTGILREQAGYVMSAYQSRFDFRTPLQREEWVLLEGAGKNAAASTGKITE